MTQVKTTTTATATKKTTKAAPKKTTTKKTKSPAKTKKVDKVNADEKVTKPKSTKVKAVKVKAPKAETKKKPTAKETTAKIKELAAKKEGKEVKETPKVKVKKEASTRVSKYLYPADIDDGMKRKRFRSTVRANIRKFEKELTELKEGTKEHKALAAEFKAYQTEVYS